MYRVFLGAPSMADINADPASYSWRTISHTSAKAANMIQHTQSLILPRATFEAANHRISLIYKDMIFENDDDRELEMLSWQHDASEHEVEISVFRGIEQTTMISWPPSNDRTGLDKDETRGSIADPSFLLDTSATPSQGGQGQSVAVGAEQQITETQALESQSFGNYSDASSIGRFPTFHFNMHQITPLSQISAGKIKGTSKINVLSAVLEVEGPDAVRIKKGADAGREVSILKIILGDNEGNVVKLTAWREVAEEWGGTGSGAATKRGDIVHIENVTTTENLNASILLTASPYLQSRLLICYRTMPYSHEDGKLRPDLRLGLTEPSVRKVSDVVTWFERMAGLSK